MVDGQTNGGAFLIERRKPGRRQGRLRGQRLQRFERDRISVGHDQLQPFGRVAHPRQDRACILELYPQGAEHRRRHRGCGKQHHMTGPIRQGRQPGVHADGTHFFDFDRNEILRQARGKPRDVIPSRRGVMEQQRWMLPCCVTVGREHRAYRFQQIADRRVHIGDGAARTDCGAATAALA